MKRLVQFTLSVVTIAIITVSCSPASISAPSPTPTPTDTLQPTATSPPTYTPTPEPTPTELPTSTPVPTPTIAQVTAKICTVFPDGKPASGAYVAVLTENYDLLIPDPASGLTGLMTNADGCRSVRVPPGFYRVIGQKVLSPSEFISGVSDFEVVLGNSVRVEIKLTAD